MRHKRVKKAVYIRTGKYTVETGRQRKGGQWEEVIKVTAVQHTEREYTNVWVVDSPF